MREREREKTTLQTNKQQTDLTVSKLSCHLFYRSAPYPAAGHQARERGIAGTLVVGVSWVRFPCLIRSMDFKNWQSHRLCLLDVQHKTLCGDKSGKLAC